MNTINTPKPTPPAGTQPSSPAGSKQTSTGSSGTAEDFSFQPPEALTTIDERGYRKWVYPMEIAGVFMRWRRLLGYFVIAVYFVTPWIKVGGMQAILLDIPQRRFVLFGHLFWPQDVFYLVFLLLGLALALFFFTAVMGRVWCGWLCPQTVFMEEIFRKIERWVEGDHHERRRLDQAPWTLGKVVRKVVKHGLFLLFSALVSNTFLAYFVETRTLLHWMISPPDEHWTAFLIMAFVLGVFYFDFAWFREQFCVAVCPYARFQAVLTDADTLQVGYDMVRGEPRGRLGATKGDCVDCYKCVAVCPTGIDIRDGYQLECIGCARCIDACDSVMTRVHKPKGLVRYDSMARLSGIKTHIMRPRVVVYSVLLVGVIAALFIGLGTRATAYLIVVRPPGDPFAVLPGHIVTNHFTVRILNRTREDRQYTIAVEGPTNTKLVMPRNPLEVKAGQLASTEAFITLPQQEVRQGTAALEFELYDGSDLLAEQSATFLAPVTP